MRELEFLPAWYPQWQWRRRLLRLQLWVSLLLVVGLGLWLHLAGQNQRKDDETLLSLKGQLQETNEQLQQMERLEVLRRQWRAQAEVLNKLGQHVESARIINKLVEIQPPNVGLLALNMELEDTPVVVLPSARVVVKDPSPPPMERRLKVRVTGVAPTDVELATFITELNKVPYFERVVPTYAKDRRDSGHIMREFELMFSINLTMPVGS